MKLQEMYDYVAANPGTTAHLPREIRRAHVGVPYEKAARLVELGYLEAQAGGRRTVYYVTAKKDKYRHSGQLVLNIEEEPNA